jgi:hypothetical protein
MESEELPILEATLSVLGVVLFLVETLPNIVHIYQKKDARPSLLPFACSWGGRPYGLSLLQLLSTQSHIEVRFSCCCLPNSHYAWVVLFG